MSNTAYIEMFENFIKARIKTLSSDYILSEDEFNKVCDECHQAIIKGMGIELDEDEIKAAKNNLRKALDIKYDIGISIEKEFKHWLQHRKRSVDNDYFFYWNRYRNYLKLDKHFSPNVINSIDKISDSVVDLLGDPIDGGSFYRRGLLIGSVQSGKTANYLAIVNKAADIGYKVIILLTGTIESLRRQTQERVDEGVIGRSSKDFLKKLTCKKGVGNHDSQHFACGFTTELSDFSQSTLKSVNFGLQNMCQDKQPVIMVLKKNVSVLSNVIKWLKEQRNNEKDSFRYPLLMIDDEADNASINTNKDLDKDPTTINKNIRELLGMFSTCSYLAVTATPFANIFINYDYEKNTNNTLSQDLFPADYIYTLDTPSNYIGADALFSDNAKYAASIIEIKDVGDSFPHKHKKDHDPKVLPETLYEALRYFLLANVVLDYTKASINQHRSMLINVTRFTDVQEKITALVQDWLDKTIRDVELHCKLDEDDACKNPYIDALRKTWLEHQPFKDTGLSWKEVQQNYLSRAIKTISICTVNQRSKGLDYSTYEGGLRVIAIGGLSLSRGLTLEGLIVSYFHRNSQMYDTLMQMGRWFGYRPGYENLFRIWMTDEIKSWYHHINESTNELIDLIYEMNRRQAEPRDFGLRVKSHPETLRITAANKMRSAQSIKLSITLDGAFFETPRFIPDLHTIRQNRAVADKFITDLRNECVPISKDTSVEKILWSSVKNIFWNNVSRDFICNFLREYSNHPGNLEADSSALTQYIMANPQFTTWDVLLVSKSTLSDFSYRINDLDINPTRRKFELNEQKDSLNAYGSKLRIGTTGLTKYGLTKEQIEQAETEANENRKKENKSKSYSDKVYLVEGRHPILIVHYMCPTFKNKNDIPTDLQIIEQLSKNKDNDAEPSIIYIGQEPIVGYAIGFPKRAGSEPTYATYYVNTQEQYFDYVAEDEEIYE